MNFKPVVLGLLVAACVTAAAGGAYLAVRQNATGTTAVATPNPSATGTPAAQPVTETEALVTARRQRPDLSCDRHWRCDRPLAGCRHNLLMR